MKLVKDSRKSWTWFSMQAMALQGAGAGAWLALPQEMRDAVPQEWLAIAAVVLTVFGMVGRVIDQGGGE